MRQPGLPGEGKKDEDMKCRICKREAVADLCRYHEETRLKVKAGYHLWAEAYGEMEWSSYLDKVKRNPRTGQWAKEIAKMLEGFTE